MSSTKWKKVENECGYPCFVDETTGNQQYDHPKFEDLLRTLTEYDGIKYSAYRVAFKIFALQRQFRVPPLRIASGVFARHQLSLSETSLSLDTAELEAVLADIYFAAEKEGLFTGDVDLTVDLLINLLLNVFDKERNQPIRVLAAKTLLITLSEESVSDKWMALANCCSDHNGCVSPKRLAALLTHLTALPAYLGATFDNIQTDVDACFDKSAGMLGVSGRAVATWGAVSCCSARWLSGVQRVIDSRSSGRARTSCRACKQPLIQVLKFKCSKCNEVYFCEKCYLYDKDLTKIAGHKKTHLVQEIIEGEPQPSQCISFMLSMKRFFFCNKKKKQKPKKSSKKGSNKENVGGEKKRTVGKPAIFTSTVGKASGHNASSPASMLQDIITQLESQNRLLKELMTQLENAESGDDGLKAKVEAHHTQISTQISRLKVVKENLSVSPQETSADQKSDKTDRPQAFDLFSPIPVEEKQSKVTEDLKSQPRVLSLDSGNFSVVSKHAEPALTPSGLTVRPDGHATTDTISTVSMNDISSWYNEPENPAKHSTHASRAKNIEMSQMSQSLSMTEQRFADDIRCMETSNDKIKDTNADLNTVLDRLQQILTNNFAMDDSCFDNTQLRETANEMEGLLGSLIRGVEQRATLNHNKGLV